MKKIFVILFIVFLYILPIKSFAADSPFDRPNNKFGIHILFPSELPLAASLVNSSGGDWGYVTIPIQSGDKNMAKWQQFMDDCKAKHLIPIIRLATEGDYFNTTVWRKPNYVDIIDFANFLNSLDWPTKNRYIIVFNEPNRGDEWGGVPNPSEYADILSFAVTMFKSRSDDFFIISAGMDNAAANTAIAMNEYNYLYKMNQEVPGIFSQVDGLGSHSYPNPGFSTPPTYVNNETITSYKYESKLVAQTTKKALPIFITETGWTRNTIPDKVIGSYFIHAFSDAWTDPRIVAVTPFLLEAGSPFSQFSIFTSSGLDTEVSRAIKNIHKVKGDPIMPQVLAETISNIKNLKVEDFSKHINKTNQSNPKFLSQVKQVAKFLLHI